LNCTSVKPVRIILGYKDLEGMMKHFFLFIQWIFFLLAR